MNLTADEIEQLLARLEETPRRLLAMSRGVENGRFHARRDPESWSANDILAHLRACADVWGKSILAMIAQEHPTMRYVSPRTWQRKTDYAHQAFHDSLGRYAAQREALLQALRVLDAGGWRRGATFTGTVRGRDQTIFSYAQRIADHEAEHLAQVEDLLTNAPPP